MNARKSFLSFLIAIITATLILPPQAFSQSAQTKPEKTKKVQTQPSQSQTAQTQTAQSKPGSAKADVPIEWPKEIQHPKGKIMIYQPQIDEWPDYRTVKARSAVAFLPTGKDNPQLGIIEMQARTEVDFESRLVKLTRLQITGANFPGATKEKNAEALAELQKMLNSDNVRSIDLDRMLVSLERAGVKNLELKNDPPKIYFSKKPAILVIFDGKPILSPIKDSELKFIVNTNWDVFYLEKDKTYFLRNDKTWLKAQNTNGPYSPADKLPDSFKKLPMNDNWKDVLLTIPPQKLKPENMPVIFISEEPAELIVLKGEPDYKPIPQTNLTWVQNTDSDLIFYPTDSNFYYLVSGRWFKTKNLEAGPWSFATPSLPEDFKKIPPDHAIGNIRASIPGTREAEEAIIQASIPQTAKINKKTALPPNVTYAGDKPQFKPIEKTSLSRAENTAYDVIQVKPDQYYLCYEGVWFVGKSATGPWAVADKIPDEIYKIPPSDPAHNVTYVTIVEDDSGDEWVTAAVTAGYFGTMIATGCVYWGTGWYYPPYYYYGGYYPYYYPHYGSYGASAWYNPATGTFGRGGWAYGPYGGVGYGARYNPSTGTYARGAAAYGPYGARGYAEAYNPRTGTSARTRQGSNYYSNWGSSAVRRGDDWVKTGHYRGQEGGAMRYRTSDGNSGFVGRNGDDLYAGRDGNVYRRSDSGWQNWDNGGWNDVNRGDVNRPTPYGGNRESTQQLDRQRAQREAGNQRARSSQSFQRSRSSMPRGGGGGMRGGGRRR
ncbi:MAG TPA: hypothetical protein VLH08_12790 [Acidobacteriota bacterium]|nr:hypothetical protein [Acidobacteriota bacterium]